MNRRNARAVPRTISTLSLASLLLVGRVPHDGAIPPEEVRILEERLPAFAIDSIPNVGHFPHEEAPEVVVQAVDRMWATITYLGALFREDRS